jgi:predicted ATP-binding protein involved in virulence
MKIESIVLENFRCFDKVDIKFNERLTVFVGENASGKSAILDALECYIILISCVINPNKHGIVYELLADSDISKCYNKDYINVDCKIDDLRFNYKYPSSLNYKTTNLGNISITTPQSFACSKELKDIFSNQQKYSSIFVYYNTQNFNFQNKNKPPITVDKTTYLPFSLSFIEEFDQTKSWFEEVNIAEAMRIRDTQDLSYKLPELEAFRSTLPTMLFDKYEQPSIDVFQNEMTFIEKRNKVEFNFSQLSQGVQSILAITLDLSRRMAQFKQNNSHLANEPMLNMPAIVLIDEIELHIHPSWQQEVLPRLLKTFPNTQFIVTTHSPQIVTSIKPENIRILDGFGGCADCKADTFGADSSDVLNTVFDVPSRPNNEVTKMLDEYLELINEGQGKSEKGLELRNELEKWIYDDAILVDADLMMKKEEILKGLK